MIGPFRIDAPDEDEETARSLNRAHTDGTPYAAILIFGAPGGDDDPVLRRAAGYRHLAERPDDGPAWLEVAQLHAGEGEYDAALAILDELERLDAPGLYPGAYLEDPDAHRAHILADAGRFAALDPLLERLAPRYADAPQFHHLRASACQDRERFEEAVEAYGDALEALSALERAASEEDAEDFDFDGVRRALEALKTAAESGKPFDGIRFFSLSDFMAPEEE